MMSQDDDQECGRGAGGSGTNSEGRVTTTCGSRRVRCTTRLYAAALPVPTADAPARIDAYLAVGT